MTQPGKYQQGSIVQPPYFSTISRLYIHTYCAHTVKSKQSVGWQVHKNSSVMCWACGIEVSYPKCVLLNSKPSMYLDTLAAISKRNFLAPSNRCFIHCWQCLYACVLYSALWCGENPWYYFILPPEQHLWTQILTQSSPFSNIIYSLKIGLFSKYKNIMVLNNVFFVHGNKIKTVQWAPAQLVTFNKPLRIILPPEGRHNIKLLYETPKFHSFQWGSCGWEVTITASEPIGTEFSPWEELC